MVSSEITRSMELVSMFILMEMYILVCGAMENKMESESILIKMGKKLLAIIKIKFFILFIIINLLSNPIFRANNQLIIYRTIVFIELN
jgi:Na+/melibiose symporter-like transporter